MIAYLYDDLFFYSGSTECQKDPLASLKEGKDVFLIPAQSTLSKPPSEKTGYSIKFDPDCNEWFYENDKPDDKKSLTPEEEQAAARSMRNGMIYFIMWRVQRFDTQERAGIKTTDSKETIAEILDYLQYLRDYPDDKKAEWWEKMPLDFDDWRKK